MKQPEKERRYGMVVPLLGLIGCLLVALSLDLKIILSGITLLIIGFVFRFVLHRIGK